MGFWDIDVRNGFDEMFDIDRDGVLNTSEQAYRTSFIMNELEGMNSASDDFGLNDLELNGIDEIEFDNMSASEKREALEEAGLDYDDWDLDDCSFDDFD